MFARGENEHSGAFTSLLIRCVEFSPVGSWLRGAVSSLTSASTPQPRPFPPHPPHNMTSPTAVLPLVHRTVFAAAALISLHDHVFAVAPVNGSSMAPALSPDWHARRHRDVVLFWKWDLVLARSPFRALDPSAPHPVLRRGDVVQLMSPLRPDVFAVKRVVALAGDAVPRGSPRQDSRSLAVGADAGADDDGGEEDVVRVVPPGHVWVEGDNARVSVDSKTYGPVSCGLVVARAAVVVWPWNRAGTRPWEGGSVGFT